MPEPSNDQLEADIVALGRALERGLERWLRLVAEFDRRNGGRRWGRRGTAECLAWRCGISAPAAREHVRVARRLADMPQVSAAFAAGDVSYSKVRALTRAAPGEDEGELLAQAAGMTAHQLEQTVRALRSAPSADPAVAAEARSARRLAWWWRADGALVVHGVLAPDDGALFAEVVEVAAETLHPPDPVAGGRPGLGARRADALVEMLQSGPPPAQVVLHVDLEALGGDGGAVCALEHGPAIPPMVARRLACDAELRIAGHRADGTVDYGRSRRLVSPSLRRALDLRDGGCRFPGCTRRHGLAAHHIRWWTRGGATNSGNLVLLCRYHHRLVHEEGFGVAVAGDEVVFSRPDGVRIPAVVAREGPVAA